VCEEWTHTRISHETMHILILCERRKTQERITDVAYWPIKAKEQSLKKEHKEDDEERKQFLALWEKEDASLFHDERVCSYPYSMQRCLSFSRR